MDKEKLNKAAEEYNRKLGKSRNVSWNDGEYGFISGAEWLMQQPLSERLTEEEKENIIADYNEDVADDEYNDGYKAALRNIFGPDIFK